MYDPRLREPIASVLDGRSFDISREQSMLA